MTKSTVARIAGNILSGHRLDRSVDQTLNDVAVAVAIARAIVAEVERTEPEPKEPTR